MRRQVLLALAFAGVLWADTGFRDLISVREVDGTPSCMAGQIKFANGNVTCSGNVATVADQNSGGGGGGMTPGSTDYIQNRDTLQAGATFYVSSATVSGPFRVQGLFNVGDDNTGFSEHSRLSFDPSANAPALNIHANRNTASASNINWINSSGATYASINVNPAGGGIVSSLGGGLHSSYGMSAATITVNDDAYGAGWNGSLLVPTKNALYDKIETISPGGGGGGSTLAVTSGTSAGFVGVVSSPTHVIVAHRDQFFVTLQGGATALLVINTSSFTAKGPDPAVAGDVTGTLSNVAVTDDSHAHTSSSLSGIDISADTNLAATGSTLLNGDTIHTGPISLSTGVMSSLPAASISAGNLGDTVRSSSFAASGFYSDVGVRSNLGLAIGTNVQAYDADLDDLTDGSLTGSKVGSGVPAANIASGNLGDSVRSSSFAASGFYSDTGVRSNLGLAIGTNVQAYDADLDDLSDGSLTGSKVGSGVPAANIAAGALGTSVVASSFAASGFYSDSGVRSNLGLAIGTNVQAYDADLDDLSDGSLTGSKIGSGIVAANIAAGTLGTTVVASSVAHAAIVAYEAALEAVMDLPDMQGSVTAGQLPADGYASTYVNSTGDTMTGQLTSISSLTVTGAGIRSPNGITAGTVTVTDDAYAVGWNGNTEVPTKNALYDKIETIGAGAGDNLGNGTGSFGVNTTTGGFSTSLIVAGQSVCLEDGTDCPAGGAGDMLLASTQTVSAHKTFTSSLTVNTAFRTSTATVTTYLDIQSSDHGGNMVRLDPNATAGVSTSVGGAVLLENTGNAGAGLIVYTNNAAPTGRLVNIRVDNAAFSQPGVHLDYDGTSNALEALCIQAGGAGDASSNCLSIVSSNTLDTSFGVAGRETGKGTIKVTHNNPFAPDGNASAISIDVAGAGTDAQGVFMDATSGTTGKLLNFRNNGVEYAVIYATADAGHFGGLEISTLAVKAGGILRFNEGNGGANYSAWKGSASYTSDTSLIVPGSCGTAAQVLHADGACGTYFDTDDSGGGGSPGGTHGNVQINTSGAFAGASGFNIWASSVVISTGMYTTYVSTLVVNSSFTLTNVSTMTFGTGTQLDVGGLLTLNQAHGTAGQVPTSNGYAVAPTWQYPMTIVKSSSTFTATGTTLRDIPNLGTTLAANTTYQFDYYILYQTTVTTLGASFAMNFPGTPITLAYTTQIPQAVDGTAMAFDCVGTTDSDACAGTAVVAANTSYMTHIKGLVVTGAAGGEMNPQIAAELNTTPTAKAMLGSMGIIIKAPPI